MNEREIELNVPIKDNKKLEEIVQKVNANKVLITRLRAANISSMARIGFADHGPVHVKIVANIALRILRLLRKKGVESTVVRDYKDYGLTEDDADIVIYLGCILHDIGMVLNREKHDELGMVLAMPILADLLKDTYNEEQAVIMTSEVLHAILMHDKSAKPLTVEAGILRIADGLDMEKGRARIPFDAGKINIHSVSALAVEKVEIKEGSDKPVEITINLDNPAGIFQIDDLLKEKINISGLKEHITVNVLVESGKNEIFKNYKL
ncbi:MAG TPA: HD domain-containing protein [Candidatus Nanoarchaeia archaeon]|nr:HD domain-containing protein [Candidatus Nanoarchaeia archaeon]